LHATLPSKLMLSLYEIVFDRCIWLGIAGDLSPMPPDVPADLVSYFHWLATELGHWHESVKKCCEELKIEDKTQYDKAHKVVIPTWKAGDYVVMR